MDVEVNFVKLPQLLESGQRNGRETKEEREACGFLSSRLLRHGFQLGRRAFLPAVPTRRPPGSRTWSVRTCQVLRPRRVAQALALALLDILPSATQTASTPGISFLSRLKGWPARSPTDTSPTSSRMPARLGADVVRYSFIVVDLHHLLLAGLPAHLCENVVNDMIPLPFGGGIR